jgi:hypothetical protein
MKRQRFNSLQTINPDGYLLKDGVLLADRKEGFFRVQLFQVGASYLEVYLHTHFNVITKVLSFTDTAFLDPYLDQINIDALR